jgi:hypothetical protein
MEAGIMVGQVFWPDFSSHREHDRVIFVAVAYRSLNLANGATTVKVGLAAVDTATGPPARAANASNVITL